jgi:protein O-GlcNAc transferase
MKLLEQAINAHRQGLLAEAETLYRRTIAADDRNFDALHMLGILCAQQQRFDEAASYLRLALSVDQSFPPCYHNYGNVLARLSRYEEAIENFDKALAIAPNFVPAYSDRGNAQQELGLLDDALASYNQALKFKPDLDDAWLGCGNANCKLKRHADALAAFDNALTLNPRSANAWLGRGNVFYDLGRRDQAFAAYDQALALNPELANAWLGRANVLNLMKRQDEALAAYDRALAVKPDLDGAWLGRGNVLSERKLYKDAIAAYDQALVIKPNLDYAASLRLHAKQCICQWSDLKEETAQLLSTVRAGKLTNNPFVVLTIPSSAADQLEIAKRYVQDQPQFQAMWQGDVYSHDRIRVAYLSADFREHPVSHLTVGLFEHHDRSRFEVTAISFGPDQESPIRRRLKGAFERFVDVAHSSDQEIADLVRALEIDIAVDLTGFTQDNRINVLARRPAPIQINYLGYPGTLGAGYIDYLVADRVIIPPEHAAYYEEEIVYVPDSFMVNDAKRPISDHTPTRGECGLPNAGFVFCCFNGSYKITPDVFSVWMRLLEARSDSVIWLGGANASAQTNLRREAERHGVSAQRLIFAPHLPNIADHLARLRQADLFLDTLRYNAHTTASDALWAGVPLITCPGSTFASRVGASLLKAIGLDELIVDGLEDYEALALKLAREPSYLRSVKQRLADNRATYPLFDTARFTRHLELAYETMWQRHQRGEPPRAFAVSPIAEFEAIGEA